MKSLSRSTFIMFVFDLLVLSITTTYWYNYFKLPENMQELSVFLVMLSGLFVLFLKGNYKIREFNVNLKNTYLLFEGCVLFHIPVTILLLAFANQSVALKFVAFNLLSTFVTLRVYRALFHFYLFKLKRIKNILIIGTDKNAKLIADEIINKKALRMNIVGFVRDTESETEFVGNENYKIFNPLESLDTIIAENNVDIAIVAIKRRMEENLLSDMVLNIPKHVKIYKMPEFYELVTGKYFIDRMSVNWLFYDFMNRRSLIYDFCKRAFDIIAALIILIVTLPITGTVALRVWITDGGNPMFTQRRVGKGGKIFNCYKLRTMYKNDYKPKSGSDVKYAESISGDDRIIPFCKFVRKARFDEIPQMINILKGEMSIVGPRAEWADEVKIFTDEIPYYNCRMWVRTGWTGWSHINMNPCFTVEDEMERLAYDLYYLKHRNVLWEISILVKAVFLALGGRHK